MIHPLRATHHAVFLFFPILLAAVVASGLAWRTPHPLFTLLLATDARKPLPKEAFLPHVSQPLQLRGVVRKTGDALFFEVDPFSISGPRSAGCENS